MNGCHCLRVSRVSTCVAMTSVHPASIAVNHALFSSIDTCVDNDISSSSFDCSETRVIFIEEYVWKNKRSSSSFDCGETRVLLVEEYVWIIKISFPASIAVKQALISSLDAWR